MHDPLQAVKHKVSRASEKTMSKSKAAIDYAHQAERLGQCAPSQEDKTTGSTQAVEAKFITAQDPVTQTADGSRLPAAPVEEATKLNKLRDIINDRDPSQNELVEVESRESKDRSIHSAQPTNRHPKDEGEADAPLRNAIPPSRTNPLFPPMPIYGPPTLLRRIQCTIFRISSAILSLCFLAVIILGAAFTSIPLAANHVWLRLTFRNPDKKRPSYQEEERRRRVRKVAERAWKKQKTGNSSASGGEEGKDTDEFIPLEGGPDPIPCDVRYYARRVGLDCEIFDVQTEDGFIIELWHLYNPREYQRTNRSQRSPHAPEVFSKVPAANCFTNGAPGSQYGHGEKKYPVLMIHGLLQSAGAYCTNDDDSLAFFLAKSGYDVWLGNNRCGFKPRHNLLKYSDPRMWAWNIRQMGVMDLPALILRVLSETGFEKLGLIAHSQGRTQTLVALAKEQRPEIGEKISVFCALAPAAYAGPLIGKIYFKFMRVISPGMFRTIFGIHAFIPFMMTMHSLLPPRFYGAMGYRVFSFMFNWTDDRWERDLRDRMFQFAPVYVSAESMRWWLGRECFAKQKCILATREEKNIEDREDEQEDQKLNRSSEESSDGEDEDPSGTRTSQGNEASAPPSQPENITGKKIQHRNTDRARYAWYGPQIPPFALWVCGADDLVDGRRLLRRFERNREPHVDIVHSKVIEGYEHLDVIWAMDAIEKVGKEVREVIWKTVPVDARKVCRVPSGCGEIREFYQRKVIRENATREVDTTAREWSLRGAEQAVRGDGEGVRDLEAEVEA
ncbi:alpha/beta-hydrolase [Lindgomyces ingoldianus]|uniref:Alpha/beta-hydrolase n=1 Tax=Lindgomyces ingoldianus TaxID=673940 RepID=A0ACB6QMG1_9PLEO|nr:alpha/beta-hydrolase [Lindgomyces ingoldianus]KAF2467502.1 alpha/beta-hydrolase [Lindgomyces ingoldianus]